MRKVDRLPDKWRSGVFLLSGLLIVVTDQLSKTWIRSSLAVGESIPELGFPRLTHVNNTGAAFGLFQGQTLPLTIISLVGLAVILLWAVLFYRRFPLLDSWLAWVSLGLVLGGTTGNLIDRLRLGYVTDFINFGFWPAFNVADSAIVVGVIIFAYTIFTLAKARKY